MLAPHCQNLNIVLDGEICSVDEKGQECFSEAVSNAKRKSVRMEKFRFYVFDCLSREEFDQGTGHEIFSVRQEKLKQFIGSCALDSLRVVEQFPYSDEVFESLKLQSMKEEWEGLMLRMDTGYKGQRSNDLLKYKNFQTEEYIVKGMETGPIRYIDPSTGLEASKIMLKNITIEHKGNTVAVGSGFTLEQRERYFNNPTEIIGKTISVSYFEETMDSKTNKCSLRFPTFVHCHGAIRDC